MENEKKESEIVTRIPSSDISAEALANGEDNESGNVSPKEDMVSKSSLIALTIAYLSVFIDILGVSIILPIIPFLALEFNASAQQIGYIYAGYAGAQMVSVPVSGKLSDTFGRRPLMLLSLFGSFAGFLFQGLAWNIMSFICARVVAGAFGGSIPICQSYIADVVPVEQRGRYFAILGSVIITAFLFGPGIGAGLAQFSLQTPMFVAAAVAFCGWVVAFFFFQEPQQNPLQPTATSTDTTRDTKQQQQEQVDGETHCVGASSDLESAEDEVGVGTGGSVDASDSEVVIATGIPDKYIQYRWLVKCMWIVSFFQMLAFSSIIYFFGLFVYDQFGWESLEVGFATMLMGVFQVVVQIFLFPKIQQRIGKHGCGILGCCTGAIGVLLLGFVSGDHGQFHGVPLLCLSVAIVAFGNAVVVPSLSAVLSRYTSQTQQGTTLGVAQSAEAFARTIGPLLWGGIYSTSRHLPFQISTAFYVCAGVVFSIVLCLNKKLPEHAGGRSAAHADGEYGDEALQMTQLMIDEGNSSVETSASPRDTRNRISSFDYLPVEEQLHAVLEENRHLKERLRLYEEMFDLGNHPDILDIQSFHK